MFESVDRELNVGVVGGRISTPERPLPPNARVNFLLAHGAAMNRWKAIPYYLGFVTAPLWDHRSGLEQAAIISGFIGSSFLWAYLARPWFEGRVGFFRPHTTRAGLGREELDKLPQKAAMWMALIAVCFGVVHLYGNGMRSHGTVWMERWMALWLFMTVNDCVDRAADMTNLRARRTWNIIAAFLFVGGWGFSGATPSSYPAVLVTLGVVNIALALLDLGLLLHFAATPLVAGSEEAVHG